MTSSIPAELRTARLLLRHWRADDAAALLPLLQANLTRLSPWLPAHVAMPAPLPELAERLGGYARDFAQDHAYRYALLSAHDCRLIGEVDLFPRAASGRVPLSEADCVELGYWLDAAHTGRGFVTEATSALLDVAVALPQMLHAEIRCDTGNASSAAVPKRLGFHLGWVQDGLEIWQLPLARADR